VISFREALDSLPDVKPPIVRYVWAAKLHHDSKDKHPYESPTLEGYEGLLKGRVHPWSKSSISLARRSHPGLLPWEDMKKQGARPPWEAHPELLEAPALAQEDTELQPFLQMGDFVLLAPKNGGVVRAVVRKGQGLVAAAMLMGIAPLLDLLSDGKMDHIITWCHILAPLHFSL
jgi:hypothetical protein